MPGCAPQCCRDLRGCRQRQMRRREARQDGGRGLDQEALALVGRQPPQDDHQRLVGGQPELSAQRAGGRIAEAVRSAPLWTTVILLVGRR